MWDEKNKDIFCGVSNILLGKGNARSIALWLAPKSERITCQPDSLRAVNERAISPSMLNYSLSSSKQRYALVFLALNLMLYCSSFRRKECKMAVLFWLAYLSMYNTRYSYISSLKWEEKRLVVSVSRRNEREGGREEKKNDEFRGVGVASSW